MFVLLPSSIEILKNIDIQKLINDLISASRNKFDWASSLALIQKYYKHLYSLKDNESS